MSKKDNNIVVRVDHVSKNFVLPHEKVTTVKGLFTTLFKKSAKTKETQHALRDISFSIKKGEFFGIVGRNGSGKSTMLKMLAGIYQPTKGTITTKGKLVPFIELGVGFNPELTGRENVYLNGAMMGFSPKETFAMYDEIVSFAELEDFMDQKLKNYSSGMQVRLAFSVAIKAQADILVVDEVLAVGDTDFQRKCYDYFKSLKRDKKTVIFVSHDMSAVREFCDRVALIESSKLMAIGNPMDISDRYDQLFAGSQTTMTDSSDNHWGNGDVEIKEAKLSNHILTDKDEHMILSVTLHAKKMINNSPSFMTGFRVFNAAGQCLYETNTWTQNIAMPHLAKGKSCEIVWECPNIYVDGSYTVDVYAHVAGEVADSWKDALRFRVARPKLKGFLVAPQVTGKIVSS